MVFLVIAAAATTLTVAFALAGVTDHPYQQTRAATAGPDVIADVFTGLPGPGDQQTNRAGGQQPAGDASVTAAAVASLVHAAGVTAHSGPYPYVYSTISFDGRQVAVVAEGRDEADAAVDQPKVTAGTWVRGSGVVLERGFAEALGARVGDQVQLGGQRQRVIGIAVTAAVPAYPSSLCHLACLMDVPQNMGLAWISRGDASRLPNQVAASSSLVNLTLADPSHAAAFVAAHQGASAGGSVQVLYTWQSIRGADDSLVEIEQVALQFGGWLLGLLALAGLAVLVGRRMSEQTRRVGLLKAVGATPATVAGVLLVEHVTMGAAAAAFGLVVGGQVAPVLASSGAGLLGSAGAPSMGLSTVLGVIAAALGVAMISALGPALRAARTSTVAALADAPRTPPRRPLVVALSARLPVPLLLGVRQLARRPRRALLNALSITVSVTGIVAILANAANTHAAASGSIANLKIDRLHELMRVIAVMLIVLAAINTTFIAWAASVDNRFSSALERALGATRRQVIAGQAVIALLPAFPAAIVGVPLGIGLYRALSQGQSVVAPPAWQLAAVVVVTLFVSAVLTDIPARLGTRRSPAQVLQLE